MEGFISALGELVKSMILVEFILLFITATCSCISKITSKNKKEK